MADLIADLLERCRELDAQHATTKFWFRGHADANWELLPTALRKGFLDVAERHGTGTQLRGYTMEGFLNDRFRVEAAPYLAHPDDLVQVYLEARHAEFPSRLLDWTTSPLIALFFASATSPSNPTDRDGKLFIMHPATDYYFGFRDREEDYIPPKTPVTEDNAFFTRMVAQQFTIGQDFSPPEPKIFDERALDNNPHLELKPTSLGGVLPVFPRYRFPRLAAQRSCFTYHPVLVDGKFFDGKVPEGPHLQTFLIPAEDKEKTREDLRLLGIDDSSMWPGPDGVSRALRGEWKLP